MQNEYDKPSGWELLSSLTKHNVNQGFLGQQSILKLLICEKTLIMYVLVEKNSSLFN